MVISMDRWKGKVAIVTGASAGIGAAIVEQLANAGVHVVALARRTDRLQQLAKSLGGKPGKIHPFQADITKEQDILAAFKWTKENVGPVHVLINNAGVARNTSLIDGDAKAWKETIDTNVLGLCIATREAVKNMRANNVDGHIVHINSVGGHKVPDMPNFNVYPGTKHAVTALTETLRQELNSIGSKIKISDVSPGAVETEFAEAAGYTQHAEVKEYLKTVEFIQPADIADAVIYVLSTPPHVQIHELMIRGIGQFY